MRAFIGWLLLAAWSPAFAINIFACEPEWGSLAKELAPEARIYVATTAMQDPHRIEARPSLIARARSADLVVCTGAELELGWLPQVLAQSGNAGIQPGQPGHFEAARLFELLEKPARLDRSLGRSATCTPTATRTCTSTRATWPGWPRRFHAAWPKSILQRKGLTKRDCRRS